MLIPMIDIADNQIGWIDHLKLQDGLLHKHNGKLWILTEGATLQEVEATPIDPEAIIDEGSMA